jgi:predicted dehydrogenase
MSKPVNLALAGAGQIGRRHVVAGRSAVGVTFESVVDPAPAARAFAKEIGAAWYSSLRELFASAAPDGVILATPNQVHLENALDCVHAGCPMLIEKPIATSYAEAKRIVDAAKTRGVAVLVGHHRRHNPLIQAARAIIDGGGLGRITSVHATCWFFKPDDYFTTEWRRKHGAGPVLVNAIHDVDLLRHLCGDIESVQAVTSNAVRGGDTEDSAVVLIRFRSGALGTLSVSDTVASPWSWELTSAENAAYPATSQSCYLIGGTKGSLSMPDNRLWSHGPHGHWMTPIHATSVPRAGGDPLVKQIDHFAAVIRGEAEPLVPGEEGLKSLAVVEAILRSAEGGAADRAEQPAA